MSNHNQLEVSVLVLGGSIRARADRREAILDLVNRSENLQAYRENVRRYLDSDHILSNSEIISGATLVGAAGWGARIEYFPLVDLFPPKDQGVFDLKVPSEMQAMTKIDSLEIEPEAFRRLLTTLEHAQGVVLSTPVYFGDRSSVANKFLQVCAVRNLLKGKVFGMVSVGAKRNGGQETTDIFGLYEAVSQGAFVVGNGPPTCQYGGTTIGGHLGHSIDDEWGLESALGTGARTAEVAEIVARGDKLPPEDEIRVAVILTMDTKERLLKSHLSRLTEQVEKNIPGVRFDLYEVIEHDIYRCLGCPTCPQNKDKMDARTQCVINDPTDYMEVLREALNHADGAVLAGLNIREPARIIFRYQVMTERMRFIRRNDFELSNLPLAGLTYQEVGATINPINSLKSMVSYIRHNTIFNRPIEVLEHEGRIIESGRRNLEEFCHGVRRIKAGKQLVTSPATIYDPFGRWSGYSNVGLGRA